MSPALRSLAVAALLAPLGALAQTLTPSGDAHVRGGSAANNNYGGVVLLGVKTANQALQTYWSYIKFDTGGVSGQVTSAKLRLLTALSSSGSVQTNLYAAPATWGETTITWNNKPALGAQLGSFTVANTGYVWFELDVTAHVRAELAQGAVGFALANPAVSSQLVAVQSRESSNPAQLVLAMNSAPSVTLTSPANGATYTAPATVSLAASAADTDGTIAKVEFFHGGTNLIATVTAAPYAFDWTNVAAGSYSLTAKATDDLNSTTTSAPVGITVSAAVGQLYFIHVDHLNTPRLVANQSGQTVWRWDQQEPFGVNVADENPSGLGTFDFPMRFPGQYADKETNLHFNFFRDYDSSLGRYTRSDPIGLAGGLNTYAYVGSSPLGFIDPWGLAQICRGKAPAVFNPNDFPECRATFVASGTDQDSDVKTKELYSEFSRYTWKDPRPGAGPDLTGLGPRGRGRPPVKPEITVAWYAVYLKLLEETTSTTSRRWMKYHLSCERAGECGRPPLQWDLDLTYCGAGVTTTSTSRGWKPQEKYLGRYAIDWYLP